MALRYLTIDFNSYFASVEQQERPELRGRPVAVVPLLAETTGCIAVSLEAKALGLKRNVRVADARRACPGLAVVESRPDVYIAYHRRLVGIVEACLHVVKTQSIDEVTCALTATYAAPDRALAVARAIKERIRREAGGCLRSSIGIAPNWLLAKLASDMQKPDGLVVLDDADLPARIARLAIDDITGIGANMARRLRGHGLDTVEKLYAAPQAVLRGLWGGVRGEQMFRLLHGEDLPFFEQEADRTIGHGHVLPPDLRNEEAAHAVLNRLVQKAAMRLRHGGHYAGGLHLVVRARDGTEWSDALRCSETQDTLELTRALAQLWARRPVAARARPPFQVGVALTHLIGAADHTPDLFAVDQERTRHRLFSAVDTLNQTFGKNTVYFGGAHGVTDYAPMRIAFTRIPEPELEEIDAARGRRLRPPKAETPPPGIDE